MTESKKTCTKCKIEKYFSEFPPNRHMKSGRQSHCRKCYSEDATIFRNNNVEKLRKDRKKRYDANPEKKRESSRRFRKENPDKIKAQNKKSYEIRDKIKTKKKEKEWREKNPEKARRYSHNYYENNKVHVIEKTKKWHLENREKANELSRLYQRKIRNTITGNLNNRISSGISRSLKNGKDGARWEELVGYTVRDLKKHLEKLFTKGMSWELFLRGEIHIDHKIPKSFFHFTSSDDLSFKQCWALHNLQPLWEFDNLSKCNRRIDW
jgi:hypothetical protein